MRFSPLLLLFCLTVLTGGGCRRGSDGPQGVKIGLSLADGSAPYAHAIRDAAQAFAKEEEFELLVQDAGGKASEQGRAIEQFLQQGVSAILVQPVDPAKLSPLASKAAGQSVYLVMLERTIPDGDVASFVQFDQELAGRLAADYLGHRLPSGGKVAVIKGPDAPDQRKRLSAFRAYLKQKHPNIEVAAEEGVRYEADQATALKRLFATHPELQAVYALSDPLALAVAGEISSQAGPRKPFVVGFGGTPAAIEELKKPDSPLAMTAALFPQQMGTFAARQAWRIVSNKQAFDVTLPVLPVTRENVNAYPGWTGKVPRPFTAPWPTELKLEVERE